MLRWACISSGVLTVMLLLLGMVAESQKGVCDDGDPIPYCPDERGLAEWGYVIGMLFWLAVLVFIVLTLSAGWKRLAKRRAER